MLIYAVVLTAQSPAYTFSTFLRPSPASIDGTGRTARFQSPTALSLDPLGILWVADGGVRKVTSAGVVYFGSQQSIRRLNADGTATLLFPLKPLGSAQPLFSRAIAVSGGGVLHIADDIGIWKIDTLHVWGHPAAGGAPQFVGVARPGGARPDVASL